jgi:hypothetical protein
MDRIRMLGTELANFFVGAAAAEEIQGFEGDDELREGGE